MVKITQTPANRSDRQFKGTNPCKYITVHETDNTSRGAGAKAHATFQRNGGGGASWHYQVDDTYVIQSYPDSRRLWHAGDGSGQGNMSSIAIETCVNSDSNWTKTRKNLAQLIATLMKRHNIPLSRVVQHNYWSGKNCPRRMRANSNKQWKELLAEVEATTTTNTVKPYKGKLLVGGAARGLTIKRLQTEFGTKITGKIGSQRSKYKKNLPAFHTVTYTKTGGNGSPLVRAVQKWLGVKEDGQLGPVTIRAWQKVLGVLQTGVADKTTVKALQKWLNSMV